MRTTGGSKEKVTNLFLRGPHSCLVQTNPCLGDRAECLPGTEGIDGMGRGPARRLEIVTESVRFKLVAAIYDVRVRYDSGGNPAEDDQFALETQRANCCELGRTRYDGGK